MSALFDGCEPWANEAPKHPPMTEEAAAKWRSIQAHCAELSAEMLEWNKQVYASWGAPWT